MAVDDLQLRPLPGRGLGTEAVRRVVDHDGVLMELLASDRRVP
jgi:hypothetical protein